MMFLNRIFFLFFIVLKSDSARILALFPCPSISHQIVFRPLIQELAKRGHEVIVLTTDPAFPKGKSPKNIYEIDFHDLSYNILNESPLQTTGNKHDLRGQVQSIFKKIANIVKAQLLSEEIQSMFRNKTVTFDLIIVEVISRAALSYSYVYKVPVIQISSFGGIPGTFNSIGVPSHPNLYPTASRQRMLNLTIWENMLELYSYCSLHEAAIELENNENEMLKEIIHPKIPPLNELRKNVQMSLINLHPLWDSNRPVTKNVIYIHGIHHQPKKNLSKALKLYLDNSKNGVIYVSFGTNTKPSLLSSEKIQILLNVFAQLKYDVVLKWDSDMLPNCPKNVRIGTWFPQADLLRHPNIKAFVTQAGLQSTDEAIEAGVPLIGIPFIVDQWFNSEKYELYKIGFNLDMESLTEDIFRNAIETAISDPSYRNNIIKLRSIVRDQPYTALQRAVWSTEYVLRHGGEHLRSPAADMRWTEYYELDLVVIILCVAIVCLILVSCLGRFIFSKIIYEILYKRYISSIKCKLH